MPVLKVYGNGKVLWFRRNQFVPIVKKILDSVEVWRLTEDAKGECRTFHLEDALLAKIDIFSRIVEYLEFKEFFKRNNPYFVLLQPFSYLQRRNMMPRHQVNSNQIGFNNSLQVKNLFKDFKAYSQLSKFLTEIEQYIIKANPQNSNQVK